VLARPVAGLGGAHAGEELLRETLKSATNDLFSRLRAVQELAKVGTPAAVQAIVDAMATERATAGGAATKREAVVLNVHPAWRG